MTFTKTDLKKIYIDGVKYLDDNFAYFLTNVLNIGTPEWTNSIPTAAVACRIDNNSGDFSFLFNPSFAESLSPEEFGFVLAHETLHILLEHLSLSKNFDDPELFNLCADAVINDYLNYCGIEPISESIRGETLIGEDCSARSVSEVYFIAKNKSEEEMSELQKKIENGEISIIDDHAWMHENTSGNIVLSQRQEDMIPDDLMNIKNDSFNDHSTYGVGSGHGQEAFAEQHGTSLKWPQLLKRIHPDIIKERGYGRKVLTSFSTPRRKLASLYPEIILPNYSEPLGDKSNNSPEKPMIVMALDTSGSINSKDKNRFISLARSIPKDKVNVMACTFTDSYMNLDLDKPKYRSGGTCFSAIERFIRKEVMPNNKSKYPSAVIVITDGIASFSRERPNKEQKKGWHWLLLDAYSSSYYSTYYIDPLRVQFSNENIDNLDEFIK